MDDAMVEAVARAIWDADEPLSGDPLGVLIVQSDHLFPTEEHFKGRKTSEAYRLAGLEVCRTAARAAISAARPLILEDLVRNASEQMLVVGAKAGNWHPDFDHDERQAEAATVLQAMIDTAIRDLK